MDQIAFPLKLQMSGRDVGNLQHAVVQLGYKIAEAEIKQQLFGETTRAAVAALQQAHGVSATGEVDKATADVINRALADQGAPAPPVPPNPPTPAARQVTGTVLHADDSPIRAMVVQAFHRRLGGEVPLGSQPTNVHGQYAIAYQQPANISKVDLLVRAYDDQQAVMAVSPLIVGAGEHETLDLTVTDQRFRGPSEFAKASDTLAPLVAGLQLDQLDANDVALMVRNTAITRESVTTWIASKRLADRTQVDHESLYALVRVESTASLGAAQSIAISGGRDDSGLFAADHRDERYLPFEGCGAISNWSVTLTSAVATFDWTSITDVVLHVHYTAREGGDLLRDAALQSLNAELAGMPLRRGFSARSEFPTEWNAFLNPTEGSADAVFSPDITEQLFPKFSQGAALKITNLELVALVKNPNQWRTTDIAITTAGKSQTAALTASASLYGGQPAASVGYGAGAAPGRFDVSVPFSQLGPPSDWADDLVLIVTYRVELNTR
jgi:peptidoglycan hydrolase-like protein with peptidoglycan-binding domain